MIDVLLAIALFFSTLVVNYAHVRGTVATVERRSIAAANWGVIVYVLGMAGWAIALTCGWWLLSFEVVGLWVGTVIGVRRR